jgi:hypothetical protein
MHAYNDSSLVPNKRIADGLFTGLFYTAGVKHGPTEGYLTYTSEKSASGNYLQISVADKEKYVHGGEWRDDCVWAFYPSEVDGWFTWGIKRHPKAYVTWTEEGSDNGKYLQIAHRDSDLSNYGHNGKWRQDALWGFWNTEHSGWYTVGCKRDTVASGYLTYTAEKTAAGHYVQLALNPAHKSKYEKGGEWREDALWGFWPSNFKIHEEHHSSGATRFTATADRVKQDGTVCSNAFVSVEVLRHFLQHNHINVNVISSSEDSILGHRH